MKITKIKLENFRAIKDLSIELNSNINIFVGINGSGKSTILDAVALSLSWLLAKIQNKDNGKSIPIESIKNNMNYSLLNLEVLEKNKTYKWKNTQFRPGALNTKYSNLIMLDELVNYFQEENHNENKLPMIVYYRINRMAKDASGMIEENRSILPLYDNALDGKANFQIFFKWFRLQDDIINERYNDKKRWMRKNNSLILKKVNEIFQTFSKNNNLGDFNDLKERLGDKNRYNHLIKNKYSPNELRKNVELLNLLPIGEPTRPIFAKMESILYKMDFISYYTDTGEVWSYIDDILSFISEIKREKSLVELTWELFQFSLLLHFWNRSDNFKKYIEKIFKKFNPSKPNNNYSYDLSDNFKKEIEKEFKQDLKNEIKNLKLILSQEEILSLITETIERIIPEYSDIRVERYPEARMSVDKDGETITFNQLSDGEKNMIAMIGDIVRRLSLANPKMKNPLNGEGVILIDEIDLHLHPSWQRVIITKLTEVFPNCQFILTTHSPQILSHVRAKHIFLLKQENSNVTVIKPTESYGMTIDRVVELIMDQDARPSETKKKLNDLYELIERDKIEEAKEILKELKTYLKTDSDILRAEMLIRKKEMKR